MPARQPTTISEVLDKDRRLRAMTPWHHNEGELSLPLYIRPSAPPLTEETPPLEFHNASCTPFAGEAPLRASNLLSRTMRDLSIYIQIYNMGTRLGVEVQQYKYEGVKFEVYIIIVIVVVWILGDGLLL
ncbi:hypothetical protein TNIN_31431 [Trichonephila inaurata madagascariensis]|uniref:Uncharacterized protein n=1 Tax=Trichonephila inaurata madagascariensis TaxID=2747483 RepID=A0A8X6YB00_9ARAC|nr:hypothetical protein TNIN_31431 [Trichonephila inaurata madagascariensis]